MQSGYGWKQGQGFLSSRFSSLPVDGYEVVGEQAADEEEVTIACVLALDTMPAIGNHLLPTA